MKINAQYRQISYNFHHIGDLAYLTMAGVGAFDMCSCVTVSWLCICVYFFYAFRVE